MQIEFRVTGMSCAACSASVERAVGRLAGVESVSVNLLSGLMLCELQPGKISPKTVIKAVEKAGFRAEVIADGDKAEKEPENIKKETLASEKTGLIASVMLLIPLMILSMGHMVGIPLPSFFKGINLALTELFLTLPVAWLNRKFFISGAKALLRKAPNMDSLVALGSGSALLYSTVMLFIMGTRLEAGEIEAADAMAHSLYFESGAMILTLVTVGKLLEERAKTRTGDAVARLKKLAPSTVTVEKEGKETEIPVVQLAAGDILVVRPGEKIAADGTVIRGSSALDTAALTGESLPRNIREGDRVLSASVNLTSLLHVKAEEVGKNSTLYKVIALVEKAGAEKAPVSRLADRVSGIFVPVVMGIALVTFAVWMALTGEIGRALSYGISVLVISCPCALGLATPVAVTVANGRLAEKGILVRHIPALENLGKIDTMVLDKTGTLTVGEPEIGRVFTDMNREKFLRLAADIEKGSLHPLAKAIREKAGEGGQTPVRFTELPGKGVEAWLEDGRYLAGSRALAVEEGADLTRAVAFEKEIAEKGESPVYFLKDGRLLGIITLGDRLREGAKEAIAAWKEQGIEVVMLTGDSQAGAVAKASQLGIDRVVAGVLPEGKTEIIRKLKADGKKVAMTGDGINDSPALALADVSIAIGSGTDIARDASDMILMNGDLLTLSKAVRFSRMTLTNIKENLFWAFFYNIAGIPLAAGAFAHMGLSLSPMIGAAAMSCSSLFVVTNALRLLKKKF